MRRSVKHANSFAMVISPAFSVSMLTSSFPAPVPFIIFLSADSTSHAIIGGTSSGSVCIVTAWSLSDNSEYNSSIQVLSCSWISLPCLSRSVIIRVFPMLCVLLTLFKLLDASIVSRISSKLCFRKSSIAYSFMVLHISTYSRWSLRVLFSIISLHFFIRTLVDYDILGIFCVLVCLAMPVARCWIISVRFLFIVSMSSSSSSSVNLIFSSS